MTTEILANKGEVSNPCGAAAAAAAKLFVLDVSFSYFISLPY